MNDPLNPHLLLEDYLTCSHGHQLYTSKAGRCTCGWVVWCRERKEAEAMHDAHLAYVAKRQEEAFIHQYHLDIARHTLRFRGPNAAQCEWCNWQVTNMSPEAIHEAFSAHKERIRREAASE